MLGGNRAQLMAAIDRRDGIRTARVEGSTERAGRACSATVRRRAPNTSTSASQRAGLDAAEKLSGEKEMLGFYVTGHPLDDIEDKVAELATHTTDQSGRPREGNGGRALRHAHRYPAPAQQGRQAVGRDEIEDREGASEAMVFSTQYERLLSAWWRIKAMLVRGLVLPEDNAPPKISIQDIIPLDVARVNLPTLISIRVPVSANGSTAIRPHALNELFARKPGQTEVRLRLEKPRDFSVILDVTTKVRPDKEFKAEVERICGPEPLKCWPVNRYP